MDNFWNKRRKNNRKKEFREKKKINNRSVKDRIIRVISLRYRGNLEKPMRGIDLIFDSVLQISRSKC